MKASRSPVTVGESAWFLGSRQALEQSQLGMYCIDRVYGEAADRVVQMVDKELTNGIPAAAESTETNLMTRLSNDAI